MAYYKYGTFLTQEDSPDYDLTHVPGSVVPISGVYRCEGCGKSTTCVKDKIFPPHGTPHHTSSLTPIRWRLVVRSHWIGGM